MKKVHISATLPAYPQTCKENFVVSTSQSYGRGSISLSPMGMYDLSVSGITDGAARRTAEYKAAHKKVTMDMLHAYEATDREYTAIHRKMKRVRTSGEYEKALMLLTPQKYKRATFALPKPTQNEVEDDLRAEVRYRNFNQSGSEIHVNESEFIKQNINSLVEARKHDWQDAHDLFNKIEDAKEERLNACYLAEYKKSYDQEKSFIEGNTQTVETSISTVCSTMKVPYDIELSYNYDKDDKTLCVKLVVENGISTPMSKAVLLASGKISVKNKLVRDTIFDRTNSAVSLVYYIGSELFSVSPNIQFLQMSLYERTLQNPLLWVEFDRDTFSKTKPLSVGVISDVLAYANISNFKMKCGTLDLTAMKADDFEKKVASMGHRTDKYGDMPAYGFEAGANQKK